MSIPRKPNNLDEFINGAKDEKIDMKRKPEQKPSSDLDDLLAVEKPVTFPITFPPRLHRLAKDTAAQKTKRSLHDFILEAIAEKIKRENS